MINLTNIKTLSVVFAAIFMITFISCDDKYPELEDGLYAEIITNKGIMVTELFYDKAPVTVASFVALSEGNHPMVKEEFKEKKYYNGLTFHRVMDSFMIQGGDPTATGTGDPGFKFEDEFHPDLKHDKPGILSMANPGPNSNGSQFFITDAPTPWLDNRHAIFGELMLGFDVLDSISGVKVGTQNKPVEDVVIQEINIIRKGSDAKNFDAPNVFNVELPKVKERQRLLHEEEQKRAEEEMKEKMRINIEAGKSKLPILLGYKEKSKKLPSGLMVHYLEKGSGPKPNVGQTAMINYEGYFNDGSLFDTNLLGIAEQHGIVNEMRKSQNAYQPVPMKVSPDAALIAGFKEALAMLKVGDKAFFYIPSHLGYGEAGRGSIEPNTDLMFLINMVEISN